MEGDCLPVKGTWSLSIWPGLMVLGADLSVSCSNQTVPQPLTKQHIASSSLVLFKLFNFFSINSIYI